MISTLTTSSIAVLFSVGSSASLGLLTAMALIMALVQKELLSCSDSGTARNVSAVLNVAIAPFLLIVGFILTVNIAEALK